MKALGFWFKQRINRSPHLLKGGELILLRAERLRCPTDVFGCLSPARWCIPVAVEVDSQL